MKLSSKQPELSSVPRVKRDKLMEKERDMGNEADFTAFQNRSSPTDNVLIMTSPKENVFVTVNEIAFVP